MKTCTRILQLTTATLAVHLAAAAPEGNQSSRIHPRGVLSAPPPGEINDWPTRIARTDPGSRNSAWAQPNFNHRDWNTMVLPTHWENAGLPDYDGVVWFRRTVDVPAAITKHDAVLSLGAIDDMDVTWVNGVRVGGHEQAGHHFTPRNYKLPAGLLKPGPNTIAVRVMDHGWNGGLAATHGAMQLTAGDQTIVLTGPWHYRPGATLAALTRPAGATKRSPPPEPFDDTFAWRDGDVMAFAGGTNMVRQFESGFLEALLTTSTDQRVYFRDIAWQADTVYRQQRPRDFGTHLGLLHRINASVVVAHFGQVEALDGTTKLPEFIAAYENLLDEFAQRTPRIILIGPRPFAKPPTPHLPDLSAHNGDVDAYSGAIRQLAERRGYLFVDLGSFAPDGLTTDGLQLTPQGQHAWARLVANQLTTEEPRAHSDLEDIRNAIQRKNTLWRQHWRPTNWSFLYGNRQHVPSSHDHRPGKGRWFPKEIDAIIPMIEQAEDQILDMRGGQP